MKQKKRRFTDGDTEAFKIEVKSAITQQDEHIANLEAGQASLRKEMGEGFDKLFLVLENNKPEYDLAKSFKLIATTVLVAGSLVSATIWLINSQVAVPINEGMKNQVELKEFKEQYTADKMRYSELQTKVTTLQEKVESNDAFIYNYQMIDKVPVQQANMEGRIELNNKRLDMIIDNQHNKMGGLK